MAILMDNLPPTDDGDSDEAISNINTTPLVDVMLVLLIIFLITIPVAIQTAPVELPQAINVPTQTRPENVIIAVDKSGQVYWGAKPLANNDVLFEKLKEIAVMQPQPEVHIRADRDARYEYVGRVVMQCQRASIFKVGFITEPDQPIS